MKSLILALPLLLVGCPTPNTVKDGDVPMLTNPDGNLDGAPPPPGDGPPLEGRQPEGAGAGPSGPEGGTPPGGDGVGRPAGAKFNVAAGEGVKLSGTILYAGTKKGKLKVDFLKNKKDVLFPELMHSITLDATGPWSVEAPKDLGDISIVSFLDSDDNGPSPGEPAGMIETATVAAVDVPSLHITLSDTPALGNLTPPTPGASGVMPPAKPVGGTLGSTTEAGPATPAK